MLRETAACIRRQMEKTEYLKEEGEIDEDTKKKMLHASLTNLASESQFAGLDNKLHFAGGSVSLQTLSNRYVVGGNEFLSSEKFIEHGGNGLHRVHRQLSIIAYNGLL